MKTIRVILFVLITSAVSTLGGQIYGTIKEGEKPIEAGVKIEITTEANAVYPTATDEFGNYRVIVPEPGKCKITVYFKGQTVQGDIQSYWSAVRFDWVLENTGEKYSLRRQ